ncbi:uncharacterized protein UDID_17903 [Ustilago sp. UG-2017a]|nr:uncharacterized protein UDID_17903 [Ustilago sp. UG-2017a]
MLTPPSSPTPSTSSSSTFTNLITNTINLVITNTINLVIINTHTRPWCHHNLHIDIDRAEPPLNGVSTEIVTEYLDRPTWVSGARPLTPSSSRPTCRYHHYLTSEGAHSSTLDTRVDATHLTITPPTSSSSTFTNLITNTINLITISAHTRPWCHHNLRIDTDRAEPPLNGVSTEVSRNLQ